MENNISKIFKVFLGAPVYTSYGELVEKYKTLILEERLYNANHNIKEASNAETMLYFSDRSLKQPLDEDASQVYFYLVTMEMKKIGKEVPDNLKVESLSPYRANMLHRVKSDLFDKIVKIASKHEVKDR